MSMLQKNDSQCCMRKSVESSILINVTPQLLPVDGVVKALPKKTRKFTLKLRTLLLSYVIFLVMCLVVIITVGIYSSIWSKNQFVSLLSLTTEKHESNAKSLLNELLGHNHETIDELLYVISESLADNVASEVGNLMTSPIGVGKELALVSANGMLNISNTTELTSYILTLLRLYPFDEVLIVTKDDISTRLSVPTTNLTNPIRFKYAYKNCTTCVRYSMSLEDKGPNGNVIPPITTAQYFGLQQSFYIQMKNDPTPQFLPISLASSKRLRLIYLQPFLDSTTNELLGVAYLENYMDSFSTVLRSLHIGKTGEAVIIEREGWLVASTIGSLIYENGTFYRRIYANESTDPIISNGIKALVKALPTTLQKTKRFRTEVLINDESYMADLTVLNFTTVELLFISFIPKSDYTADIDAKTQVLVQRLKSTSNQVKEENDKKTSDVTSSIQQLIIIMVIVGVVVSVVATVIGLTLSYKLGEVLHSTAVKMAKLAHLDMTLTNEPEIESNISEIATMQKNFFKMSHVLEAFSRYAPLDTVKTLLSTDYELLSKVHMQELEITIMFMDIEGFTKMAEDMPFNTLMFMIGNFFEEVSNIITLNNGTIDKYIGDCVMSIFGAPKYDDEHAYSACRVSLECQQTLDRLNLQWRESKLPNFRTRVGIHCGTCLVGVFGTSSRLSYTCLGDAVNLASRLEALNKDFHTSIIISDSIYAKTGRRFACRQLGTVAVRGKQHATLVYELKGYNEPPSNHLSAIDLESNALEVASASSFKL